MQHLFRRNACRIGLGGRGIPWCGGLPFHDQGAGWFVLHHEETRAGGQAIERLLRQEITLDRVGLHALRQLGGKHDLHPGLLGGALEGADGIAGGDVEGFGGPVGHRGHGRGVAGQQNRQKKRGEPTCTPVDSRGIWLGLMHGGGGGGHPKSVFRGGLDKNLYPAKERPVKKNARAFCPPRQPPRAYPALWSTISLSPRRSARTPAGNSNLRTNPSILSERIDATMGSRPSSGSAMTSFTRGEPVER